MCVILKKKKLKIYPKRLKSLPISPSMDSSTTIQELKEKTRKFCDERDWAKYHNPKDLAIGVITEAA